jgi:hypothetical protein
LGAAIIALAASAFVIRRQAFSDAEPFWSPPTRRVAQAVMPAFLGGAMLALIAVVPGPQPLDLSTLISLWILLYGCGLHAAAFFMQRGMRWFAWIYILLGAGTLALQATGRVIAVDVRTASLTMGLVFGVGHLAYGLYLRLTEPGNSP